MMKRKIICMMFLLLGIAFISNAQGSKFKILFIYNFIKNVEWPVTDSQSDFVIGVLENGSFHTELQNMLSDKMVGKKQIVIKRISSISELENFNLLFVSNEKSNTISGILSNINKRNILLVTEKNGMIESGSAINFILSDGKLTYEIKKENIEKYGLKVSARLIDLGIEK